MTLAQLCTLGCKSYFFMCKTEFNSNLEVNLSELENIKIYFILVIY